jgi:hypothetical protein
VREVAVFQIYSPIFKQREFVSPSAHDFLEMRWQITTYNSNPCPAMRTFIGQRQTAHEMPGTDLLGRINANGYIHLKLSSAV